jgi:hypothetical protein
MTNILLLWCQVSESIVPAKLLTRIVVIWLMNQLFTLETPVGFLDSSKMSYKSTHYEKQI